MALFSLEPWEENSVDPGLSVSPELGIGLGDAVAVIPGKGFRLAEARVAPPGPPPILVDGRGEQTGPEPAVRIGIAAGQAVQVSVPAPASPPPQKPAAEPAPAPVPVAVPAPEPEPALVAVPVVSPQLDADFERPHLQSIFDREDGASDIVTVQVHEGEEYAFAFSFQILQMVYGEPGADNLIVHLDSDAGGAPRFGLQLWDYAADEWLGDWRGIWASGEAVGGDRFLAPVTEREWHQAIVHFEASSLGTGYYEVFLDGLPVDARSGVSLIAPGSDTAQIELGLFRDGERVQGTSEILFAATRLGSTVASVQSE